MIASLIYVFKYPNPSGVMVYEGGVHPRPNEILFIDARNLGHLINRRPRELSNEDIELIADTYHRWRTVGTVVYHRPDGATTRDCPYEDIKGFCCSAPIERVKELDYVLTAGRYVGLPDEEILTSVLVP